MKVSLKFITANCRLTFVSKKFTTGLNISDRFFNRKACLKIGNGLCYTEKWFNCDLLRQPGLANIGCLDYNVDKFVASPR